MDKKCDGNFVDINQLEVVPVDLATMDKAALKTMIQSLNKANLAAAQILEKLSSVVASEFKSLYETNCPKYFQWILGLEIRLKQIQEEFSKQIPELKIQYVILTECTEHESYVDLHISDEQVLDVFRTNHFPILNLLAFLKNRRTDWFNVSKVIAASLSGDMNDDIVKEFMLQAIDSKLFGLVENILNKEAWSEGSEEKIKRLNQVTLEVLCKERTELGRYVTLLKSVLGLPIEFKPTQAQLEYLLSYVKFVDTFLCKHYKTVLKSPELMSMVTDISYLSKLKRQIVETLTERQSRQQKHIFALTLFHITAGAALDWYNKNNDQQEQSRVVFLGPQVVAFLFQLYLLSGSTNT